MWVYQGKVEEAAEKAGRGWSEKALKNKGFFFPLLWRQPDPEELYARRRLINQIFSLESLAAIAGEEWLTMQTQKGY